MVEILKIGITQKIDDEVRMVLIGDLPDNCAIIFIKVEDLEEAKRLLS